MGAIGNITFPPAIGGIDRFNWLGGINIIDCYDMSNLYPTNVLELRAGYEVVCQLPTFISGGETIQPPLINAFIDGNIATSSGSILTDGTIIQLTGSIIWYNWDGTTLNNSGVGGGVYPSGKIITFGSFDDVYYHKEGTGTLGRYNGSATSDPFGSVITSNIFSYKGRIYTFDQSLNLRYAGREALSGSLTAFNTRFIFTGKGKGLIAGAASFKVGEYLDELIYLVTSSGEMLIYTGDYPEATNWTIVGRYQIGEPLSASSFAEVQGDVIFVTKTGVKSLKNIIQNNTDLNDPNFYKINNYIQSFTANNKKSEVNRVEYSPRLNALFVLLEGSVLHQSTGLYPNDTLLVCNLENGAWTKFTYPNESICSIFTLDKDVYAGTVDGKFLNLNADSIEAGGIDFQVTYGFTSLGATSKNLHQVEITSKCEGGQQYEITPYMNFDYGLENKSTLTSRGNGGTVEIKKDITAVRGQGDFVALKISGNADALLELYATKLVYESANK